jgi:aspartyl/glutamyl-tRNA(Asn/Gln) amidotransferase C subunit
MSKTQLISTSGIVHLALLANLVPPSEALANTLQSGVEATLDYAKILSDVDVSHVNVTNEVSGLTNILREDVIDSSRTFTQDEALSNAKAQYNGFFMVDAILE